MYYTLYPLLALSASALAVPSLIPTQFSCGTLTTPEIVSTAQDMLTRELAGNFTVAKRAEIEIKVYFHIVSASSSNSDGSVDNYAIIRQVQVLNDRFAPQGIHFNLAGLDRTVNPSWANDQDELAMKRALRKGTYRDLNLYIQKSMTRGLGYCRYPYDTVPGSDGYIVDGCNLNYIMLPGQGNPELSTGIAGVHETGHWFGLMHTFEGNSCSGPGDNVADTPQQASYTNACPSSRDSCPNLPGTDPIHNYMDYSNDACKTEFTAGQKTRMFNMYNQFRAGK